MTRPAHALDLRWLLTLRWAAIAGQLATIAAVAMTLDLRLPLAPLLAIIAVEAATNAVAALVLARGVAQGDGTALGLLAVDVLALTGLLYFTGGPHNPFNFLYLVHIALAAVVLRPGPSWALAALSVASFGALFFDSVPLDALGGDPHAGHAGHAGHVAAASASSESGTGAMDLHLRGMWVAFTVGAVFIVYFVSRVKSALAQREEALSEARADAERAVRLASLATLAAGAAHELATPLATIAIAARELELELDASSLPGADDARLIRSQVERCRAVLDQLGVDAGASRGERLATVPVGDLVRESLEGVAGAARVDVQLPRALQQRTVPGFRRTLVQSLRAVVRNALDASLDPARVAVSVAAEPGGVAIVVVDVGEGMDEATLARATEPFFTTKGPGRGMGLGLFLARTELERLGGALDLISVRGQGTTVTLRLPSPGPVDP